MSRAGVFIGVDRTGRLDTLRDAAAGARRMYEWALSQGMADPTHARLLTDAGGGKVTPDMVQDAIDEIVNGPGVDQLVLYFAGHGVNINRNEHWLLSDAPDRTSAAVNVSGSVELARYCGIGHVVVISDACRVAPEGIAAQNVRGVDAFPNTDAGDRAKPVDQMFACYLGRTAAELKDPKDAADAYTALYTSALLDALTGRSPDVLEPGTDPGDAARYVRVRPLSRFLEEEVPRRVKARNLELRVNQNPDAIITSDGAWLARVQPSADTGGGAPPPSPPSPPSSPRPPTEAGTLAGATQRVARRVIEEGRGALYRAIEEDAFLVATDVTALSVPAGELAIPFGPDRFETQCGIKVRGARVTDFFVTRAQGELLGGTGEVLRLDIRDGNAVSVLVRLDSGEAAVVPAIRGFVAAVTCRGGEIVDLAYEPSANHPRSRMFQERADEIRELRTVAALSSHHGRFRLHPDGAEAVARRMQYGKGMDPTLAVYAAYAYHDLQELDRLRRMSELLRGDVGVTFFDLELLGRSLVGRAVTPQSRVVPFFPLLSQGWALLRANRVRLHPAIEGLETHLRDSLWTLFDGAAYDRLHAALATGDLR